MRSIYMFKQISRLFEAKMVSRASDIETDARKSQNCRFFSNECENYLTTTGKWVHSPQKCSNLKENLLGQNTLLLPDGPTFCRFPKVGPDWRHPRTL